MKVSTHLQDQTRGDRTLARRVEPLVSYQWSGSKTDERERGKVWGRVSENEEGFVLAAERESVPRTEMITELTGQPIVPTMVVEY